VAWEVLEVDGHDHAALEAALESRRAGQGKPLMVVAHTIKGKGVGFMENKLEWHYRNVDAAQLESAIDEVGRE
jgi:transketolase